MQVSRQLHLYHWSFVSTTQADSAGVSIMCLCFLFSCYVGLLLFTKGMSDESPGLMYRQCLGYMRVECGGRRVLMPCVQSHEIPSMAAFSTSHRWLMFEPFTSLTPRRMLIDCSVFPVRVSPQQGLTITQRAPGAHSMFISYGAAFEDPQLRY